MATKETKTEGQQNQARGMSEDDLAKIEARARAASPGPWVVNQDMVVQSRGMGPQVDRTVVHDRNSTSGDRQFIAHARNDVPSLVNEVRRLREALEKLRLKHRSGMWPDEQGARESTCPIAAGLSDNECTCGAKRHNTLIDEVLGKEVGNG